MDVSVPLSLFPTLRNLPPELFGNASVFASVGSAIRVLEAAGITTSPALRMANMLAGLNLSPAQSLAVSFGPAIAALHARPSVDVAVVEILTTPHLREQAERIADGFVQSRASEGGELTPSDGDVGNTAWVMWCVLLLVWLTPAFAAAVATLDTDTEVALNTAGQWLAVPLAVTAVYAERRRR